MTMINYYHQKGNEWDDFREEPKDKAKDKAKTWYCPDKEGYEPFCGIVYGFSTREKAEGFRKWIQKYYGSM